jgi:hypothetical protein
MKNAPEYFYGAFMDTNEHQNQLIGFVNGTLSSGPSLEHDSMTRHDPKGRTLCIHSVVIAPELRRRGYATR